MHVMRMCLVLLLAGGWLTSNGRAQETTPPAAVTSADTNGQQQLLRAYLELQEQLHSTRLAMERTRQESDAALARHTEALSGRLEGMEKALSAQRAKELEAMQSANRVMLIVAGTFAGAGVLGLMLTAWFQWRAVNRMAEIASTLPTLRALPPPSAGSATTEVRVHSGGAERAQARLLESLSRLERRILELEDMAKPALPSAGNGSRSAGAEESAGLEQAKALLEAGQAEEALGKVEWLLAEKPGDAAALVVKGDALERLRRSEEALGCYDAAIGANPDLTIAYLQKGGLLNRLERFDEALECYEAAMKGAKRETS